MTDIGVLGKVQIEGTWTQKRLILPVIQAALERTPLASPAIGPTMTYAKLKGTIPLLGPVPVQSQLDEFEHAVAGGGLPSGFDIEVLKDRVILYVSDEAEIESDVGDPMSLQQNAAAGALTANLNKLIAEKLNTTPQVYGTGGDLGNWSSSKPTLAIGKMAAKMGVHRPTAIVMGTLAGAYYADAVGDKVALANLSEWRGAVSIHPILNIPVFISTDIDNLDDTSGNRYVFASCNTTPGVVTVFSKIKAREYDVPELGARAYQYDIWRSPFSNIQQTSSSKNLGVMWGYMKES